MLSFRDVLGQRAALAMLVRLLDRGRIPHALLFSGPEGVGKAAVAATFSSALLCGSAGPEGPCGRCASCRMIEQGNHPDRIVIGRLPKTAAARGATEEGLAPEPDELHGLILVSQIRELAKIAALTPRIGPRRVFTIDPADRMNVESQNALLKTLEEPPGRTVLILLASRPHLLLPTVRSRCFEVGFSALRAPELGHLLERRGLSPVEAAERAALAEGRPGRALVLDVGVLRGRREDLTRMLESLSRNVASLADLPEMAASLAGPDEATLLESLDLLEALLRDAARAVYSAEASDLAHSDLWERLASVGRRLGAVRAAEIVLGVERARGYLRFNTNRMLIAESLLAAVAGGPVP